MAAFHEIKTSLIMLGFTPTQVRTVFLEKLGTDLVAFIYTSNRDRNKKDLAIYIRENKRNLKEMVFDGTLEDFITEVDKNGIQSFSRD